MTRTNEHRWYRRAARYPLPAPLLAALIISGAGWSFIALADEVFEGDTHRTDTIILLSMREADDYSDPLGPGWLEEMGRDFTALGGIGVLTLIAVGTLIYLLMSRKYRAALFTLVAVSGGWGISTLLKDVFERPRPDLVPHESIVYSASFPGGHSMMAAVTYLTLAALVAQVQPRRRQRYYLLFMAILLTVLVGISRVYLGVHWPTDVLAGWTAGAAWATTCWIAARMLQRRGDVEGAAERGALPPLRAI